MKEKMIKGLSVAEYMREYYQRPDVKAKQRVCKLGNVKNIKRLCLEYGFSEDVAEAIAVDGEMLNKKLGIKPCNDR